MAVVLITGCSSGFGRETAHAFARRGDRVYAGVRRERDGAALAADAPESDLRPVLLDVTDRARIAALAGEILAAESGIDVLVNNAGIAAPGAFEDTGADVLERIMRVNFYGPVWLTRALLPSMRKRRRGCIIMVSSLSALVGLPGEAYYAASKAAMEAAAESLRHEVVRFGIRVTVVQPGHFETGIGAKMAAADAGPPGSAYRPLIDHLTRRSGAAAGSGDDPRLVAEAIVELAADPKPAFRHPVGAQAERVAATLKNLDEHEREALIDAVNDTGWWSAG